MSKHHRPQSSVTRAYKMRILWPFQDRICALCLGEIMDPDSIRELGCMLLPYAPSLDHFVPASQGGPHSIWNMLLVHRVCNEVRADGPVPPHTLAIHERIFQAFAPGGSGEGRPAGHRGSAGAQKGL